ncbi:hypothetical protein Droror1_Dr00000691 [Drosera rotundifolia]
MGNLVAKKIIMEETAKLLPVDDGFATGTDHGSRVRVKVKLSKKELRELMEQVVVEGEDAKGKSSEKLGRLILQRGLEGRYHTCCVFPVVDDGRNIDHVSFEAKKMV